MCTLQPSLSRHVKVEARAGAAKELNSIHSKELAKKDARIAELEKTTLGLAEELADKRKELAEKDKKHAEETNKLLSTLAEEKKKCDDEKAKQSRTLTRQNSWAIWDKKDTPVKLTEAEEKAVKKIKDQAKREDAEAICCFEFLDKHQLMDLPDGALLPKYQDLKRDKHQC